jgi:hypothetical protein
MALPEYDTLKQLVAEVEDDLSKAVGGNKAAGTRVRKKMQEIKAEAQKIRQRILENRETEPVPGVANPAEEGGFRGTNRKELVGVVKLLVGTLLTGHLKAGGDVSVPAGATPQT